jgi:putative cardiolipin synthase
MIAHLGLRHGAMDRRGLRAAVFALCTAWALVLAGCVHLPREVARLPSSALADSAGTPLARIVEASLPAGTQGQSGFRILPTGDFAFDARLALAARAVKTIDAQYYQVHSDAVGHRFLRALRDAAARGVRVRLLIDDFYTTGQDPLLAQFAAHPNVQLRLFNPLPSRAGSSARRVMASLHEFGRVNHRMHNKLFVADNALAVAGGRNIGDEYFMSGAQANFIDMDALAAGPIVRELSAAFDRYWNSQYTYPFESIARPAGDAAAAQAGFEQRLRIVDGEWPVASHDMFGRVSVGDELAAGRLSLAPASARLLVDVPDKVKGLSTPTNAGTAMADAVTLMRQARSEVVMASPYFIPGERGVELMREAIAQGVHMSVLTNAADATDEPLVHFAYARYRQQMLQAGVSIYELGGKLVAQSRDLGIFHSSLGRLHAKVSVIDRRWVTIGSLNLDLRSARANTEQTLAIESPTLAHEVLSLVERSGHVAGAYKLRLDEDGRIEWVSRDGDAEVVTRDEPGATPLSRLWLWLLSSFVGEDLL